MPLSMLTGNLQTQTLPYLRLSDKVYQALELMNENHVEHLPIVEGDKYVGMISEDDLSQAENDRSSLEQIKQLNTNVDPTTGLMEVTIKINKTEVSDIVASFQRHEYNVKYYFGEELFENELRTNYDNLMNYLKI